MNKYIEFEAIKEPWNIYKLQDGSHLRLRFILIKVIWEGVDEAINPVYSVNSDTVIGVIVPENLMGKPAERTYTVAERVDAVEQELDFEIVQEAWSEYKFNDGADVKIKPVLTKVARTSLFDSKGEPLYLVNTQPIVNVSIPKELREKLKALKK